MKLLLDEMWSPAIAAALRAGRAAVALILTSNRAYPRASRRTADRLVMALDSLLSAGHTPEVEYWLD